ncbi:hypothetical protein BDZ89DRAFT_1156909 [Hymenopellis radicata]|nr:hypothetical protein BDZ89DRAFT_1156909 [Hymenopellis radicata]
MSSDPPTEVTVPLPRGRTECCYSMCMYDDDEPIATFRCSTCKNQFYCSAQCQKKDWKSHKYNCSPLNGPSAGITRGKDFDDELERMDKILSDWMTAFQAAGGPEAPKGRQIACSLPEAQVLRDLEQSALLPQYTRELPDSSKYPYRRPIVLIARIFLVELVTQLSPENKKTIEDYLVNSSDRFPPDFASLYGPKFTARPADLSPGEYAQFPSIAVTIVLFSQEVRQRWISTQVAINMLWSASDAASNYKQSVRQK